MAVKTMKLRVKAEGGSGLAFYIGKHDGEALGVKPGDYFEFIYSDKNKNAGVLTKNVNFNPASILSQILGFAETELRAVVKRLGPQRMAEALPHLLPIEEDILKSRADSPKAETLMSIGKRWGVSRERARQIEERLCGRLMALEAEGSPVIAGDGAVKEVLRPGRKTKAFRELSTLARKAPPEDLETALGLLKKREAQVIRERILSQSPASIEDLAKSLKRTAGCVRLLEARALLREVPKVKEVSIHIEPD